MEFESTPTENETLRAAEKKVTLTPIHQTVEREEDPNEWREEANLPIANLDIDSESTNPANDETTADHVQFSQTQTKFSHTDRAVHVPAIIGAVAVCVIAGGILLLVWLAK